MPWPGRDALLAAAEVTPPEVVDRAAASRALTARLADNEVDGHRLPDRRGQFTRLGPEADVDARDRELEQAAGTTRYLLARVPGGDNGPDARAEAAAADEFTELVLSDRGRRALPNSGLRA